MLILPIKKKWFDMILSGEKKEEYRDVTKYYDERLLKYFGATYYGTYWVISPYNERDVIFRNGYSRKSPQIKCRCTLDMGCGVENWGAIPFKQYYILKIHDVKDVTLK